MAKGKIRAANVYLWGKQVGAVAWDEKNDLASFEYTSAFIHDGFEISPLVMRRRKGIFSFPALDKKTFLGLPGLLADSLPDTFGNALIDAWLTRKGWRREDFSPVDRLCYIASRGMGALEFKPEHRSGPNRSVPIEIDTMIQLAQYVIDNRADLLVDLKGEKNAVDTILRIGTSAGGARAKALVAWNRKTGEIRSGQVSPPPGFEPWILKFDGVKDAALGVSQGYGRIEYAYHRMATEAGMRMSECHLLEESGRTHFMTRRFDRTAGAEKLHMQSLCAIAHYNFNMAGAYSYEQVFTVLQKLHLGYDALEEMFRRMVFNVVGRNQDDHTKNIAFVMDTTGRWSLSPAFDVMWAYNPSGPWTIQHQMTLNGKRDNFTRGDILGVAKSYGIKRAAGILDEVDGVIERWPAIAEACGIPEATIERIGKTHRRDLK